AARDACAECFADCLMAEADAEEGNGGVGANELEHASGARRSAGAGRDDDRARTFGDQPAWIELVIAHDAQLRAGKPLDLLHQVVSEGVVVIDDDYAGAKETPRRGDGCS